MDEKAPPYEASSYQASKQVSEKQAHAKQSEQIQKGNEKYSWDSGRLTHNHGLGIRFNRVLGRWEIYQGSCDRNNP